MFAPEYNVEFGHEEQRDGDLTEGSYYVLLPDGRRQLVEYTADRDGYKPRITYTEAAPGADGRGSAGGAEEGATIRGLASSSLPTIRVADSRMVTRTAGTREQLADIPDPMATAMVGQARTDDLMLQDRVPTLPVMAVEVPIIIVCKKLPPV